MPGHGGVFVPGTLLYWSLGFKTLGRESCQHDGPKGKSSGFCRESPGTADSPGRFLSHVSAVNEEG